MLCLLRCIGVAAGVRGACAAPDAGLDRRGRERVRGASGAARCGPPPAGCWGVWGGAECGLVVGGDDDGEGVVLTFDGDEFVESACADYPSGLVLVAFSG